MKTKIVNVRALPRPGHKLFCRGGHRWPEEGRTVEVTLELLTVLRAEKMLAVDLEPTMPPEGRAPELGVLEYVDNRFDDREHNASAGEREENARLKAKLAVRGVAAENEKLRAQLAAVEDDQRAEVERARLEAENDRLRREAELATLREENEKLRAQLAAKPSGEAKPEAGKGDDGGGKKK